MFFKRKYYLALLLILIGMLTIYVYWDGLFGDYVFDDQANILENKKIQINSLDLNNIIAVWFSGGAGPLGRPISMLTFALNYYFTGFDPFYFKLTNLIIHLINGLLVYFISYKLFLRLKLENNLIKNDHIPYMSCLVCLIWLIHPLNITSVLYVVQRMTSLSTLFGLIALLIYCSWRTRIKCNKYGIIKIFIIIISLSASILSKETGVLFILLIYWLELMVFKGKNSDLNDINIYNLSFYRLLWVGAGVGVIIFTLLSIPFMNPTNFFRRDFNLEERLLTEARVIFYYLKMFFYPLLSDLSLYHDDFKISKSLINPITTLYSVLGIFFISLVGLFFLKKQPLILFAWGWYLISQLLESTFISLELVHEHRNYFGTIGFILVIIYYIFSIKYLNYRSLIYVVLIAYLFNLAFITWQRAAIWSNLVDHAAYEAMMHPESDRANYQMARIYMKLMDRYPEQKLYYAVLAKKYLVKSKNSYMAGNGAWFAELHLNSYLNEKTSQKTINELIYRLEKKPFYNNNIAFLSGFSECQIKKMCIIEHNRAVEIISAPLENNTIDDNVKSEIYKLLAQYYIGIISDFKKGEIFLKEAIQLNDDVNGRLLLSQTYRLQYKLDAASEQLYAAKKIDTTSAWSKEIANEARNIKSAFDEGKKKNED